MGNTSWFRKVIIDLSMMTLLLLPSIMAGNQTHKNSECEFADIESRLSIASEMIETAKQKLPKDLNKYCKNLLGNEPKTCDCNETRIMDCNETRIMDCNETRIMDCNETRIMDCNETRIMDCNETKIVECNEPKLLDCKECENKTCYTKPLDCSDIYLNGERENGIYHVWPQSRASTGPLQVYCDMESNGGGWTVIQRRGDYGNSDDYFFREWDAYKTGFGDVTKEFWLGNDNLFALTNQRQYQLRVNLTAWDGEVGHATYDEFWILDESANYKLHVKGYNGTAGDSLAYHDGMQFSTTDKDNDITATNCAAKYKGAWWYNNCLHSNLNGMYLRGVNEYKGVGVTWRSFKGSYHSLKDAVMKIRSAGFSDVINRI